MNKLKCWPGAVCQITSTLYGTDLEQLLGRIVKTVAVAGESPFGAMWLIEKAEPVNITRISVAPGCLLFPGDTGMLEEIPDAWLTPFQPLAEPDAALEDSELDVEHSFDTPKEPEHA